MGFKYAGIRDMGYHCGIAGRDFGGKSYETQRPQQTEQL
jgi:hypothetical protein